MPHYRLPTLRGAFYFTLGAGADAIVDSTGGEQNVFALAVQNRHKLISQGSGLWSFSGSVVQNEGSSFNCQAPLRQYYIIGFLRAPFPNGLARRLRSQTKAARLTFAADEVAPRWATVRQRPRGEVEGIARPVHGAPVGYTTLADPQSSLVRMLVELGDSSRMRCRHVASIPTGCRTIFCTSSGKGDFHPRMTNEHDHKGAFCRQVFQKIVADARDILAPMA